MQLEFYGAAGEVTGSCHVLTVRGSTVLLDCGLIQGGDEPDVRNRAAFPFDPARIAARCPTARCTKSRPACR